MTAKDELFFPPFRFDLANEQLFRGEQLLQIRPKNLAVLRYLVERAGQVIRKDDLIKMIWGKYESEGALKQSIFQLREQLEDDAEEPRFIETVPRGYRFIAEIKRWLPQEIPLPPNFVGRAEELRQLQHWSEQAKRGERQIVFVTGEPGIGKTTLLDAIVAQLAVDPTVWIGRGQCIEQYGEGEAYLPTLEALGRIGRRAGAEQFGAFLGRYAPTWLAQLPALIDEEKQEALQRRVQGATRQRMLRELVEAVEIFTSEETSGATPSLVLILEDLQWSDNSTLDLLSSLARRQEPARLLILGTYRPAEGLVEGHPLRAVTQELQGHGQCQELALGLLNAEAVETYVEKRFPASVLPSRFAEALYRLTNGNPLFLVAIVDDLVRQAILVEVDGHWVLQTNVDAIAASVPDNIRQLITRQIDRLGANEQRILKAASIAGLEFSAAAVAAAVETDRAELETCCDALVRGNQFLQPAGHSEWPDGTVASRYSFRHAQYQYLWQERVSLNERQQFHQRIGEREEKAYGNQVAEIAAELAVHFGEGHNYPKSVQYRKLAAERSMQRHAYREAIEHINSGLKLIPSLSNPIDRIQHELPLQISLGVSYAAAKSLGAPEIVRACSRARELCQQIGDTPQLLPVLVGLCGFYMVRAELQTAQELGGQIFRLAQKTQEEHSQLVARFTLGPPLFWAGQFQESLKYHKEGLVIYRALHSKAPNSVHTINPGVSCLFHNSMTLWYLGYPDQALQQSHETLTLAQELGHPLSMAVALFGIAAIHKFRKEPRATQERVDPSIAFALEHDLSYWLATGTIIRSWALAMQGKEEEGMSSLQRGIEGYRATGAEVSRPYWLSLLARVYSRMNQPENGLYALTEAFTLVQTTGEHRDEAELYRLKGELMLQQAKGKSPRSASEQEAEQCFLKALHISREQSAKSLELRAAISLGKLWNKKGRSIQAKQLVEEIYGWFTEGFETEDLREARQLLEELK